MSSARAARRPSRAPTRPVAARAISACSTLKLWAMAPTSSRDATMTGVKSTRADAASRSPAASARIAREKSFIVPVARRSAASATSLAEWAIIPGSTSPTVIVRMATATKMSCSADTSAPWPAASVTDRTAR